MYTDRMKIYRDIETFRNTKLIVYVTGDRRGLETKIAQEVLDIFIHHLDIIGNVPKISLLLYTKGGDTLAAWSIVNLINQFCDDFEVIIPSKALSAGTLISLGANPIVMTKQATLGPIDPSVNTPLNPQIPGAPPNNKFPVNVEAINGFIELAKEIKDSTDGENGNVLSILSQHVHPLVLGEVYRTINQIRMLGKRLLSRHIQDSEEIDKILSFLCSESGSHDYTIYADEAKELGLLVEEPNPALYKSIRTLYNDIVNELQLTTPFNPIVELAGKQRSDYLHKRALIESYAGGSHKFISQGELIKQQITTPQGITNTSIQDNRSFEGWDHENNNV